MKILIVEDAPELMELIRETLLRERYIVEEATTYSKALDKISGYDYDCILLDLMLPDGDGLSLLERLRQMGKRDSVICISARGAVEDRVRGLELGADDYLAKPFHLSELLARIRSVIRRKQSDGARHIEVGNLRIDPDSFEVFVAQRPLELSRKEYDLLHYLAARPERLINKSTMVEAIWGDYIDQADNFDFVYAQIKNLRKKLKEAACDLEIKSVYGVGYKLIHLSHG